MIVPYVHTVRIASSVAAKAASRGNHTRYWGGTRSTISATQVPRNNVATSKSASRKRHQAVGGLPADSRGNENRASASDRPMVSAALSSSTMAGSYARTVAKSAIGTHTTSARSSHGCRLVAAHSARSCTTPTVTT
jgi:flagellar capping protein FliD